MEKISVRQSVLLAAMFPFGPLCVIGVSIAVFFGLFALIGNLTDDVETAGFASLFLFIPVTGLILILLFLLFIVLAKNLRSISNVVLLFPLIGILIFFLFSFAYAAAQLSSMGYGFDIMRTATNILLTPLDEGINSNILGKIIVPLLATTFLGTIVVLLGRQLGFLQKSTTEQGVIKQA